MLELPLTRARPAGIPLPLEWVAKIEASNRKLAEANICSVLAQARLLRRGSLAPT